MPAAANYSLSPDPRSGESHRFATGAVTHRIAYRLTMEQFRQLIGSAGPFGGSTPVGAGAVGPMRRPSRC